MKSLSGVQAIALASASWGFTFFFAKLAGAHIAQALQSLLMVIGDIIILIAIWGIDIKKLNALLRTQFWPVFSISFCGISIAYPLWFYSLRELDLGVCNLLEKLQPLWVLVLSYIFLKEKLRNDKYVYAALAMLSAYCVSVTNPFNFNLGKNSLSGLVAIMSASVFWAICTLVGRSIAKKNTDAIILTQCRVMLAVPFLLAYVWYTGELVGIQSLQFLPVIQMFLAALFSVVGLVLYYDGLKTVTAPIAAVLELITPVVAIALGVLVLSESLSISQWIAAPVLLLSAYFLARE